MPNKQFLEEYPLYKKFKTNKEFYPGIDHTYLKKKDVPMPAVHMYCQICESEQTFNMQNQYGNGPFELSQSMHKEVKDLRYICSACNEGLIVFLVYFGTEKSSKDKAKIYFEKVGQIPAWSIEMDSNLEAILGENAEYYKKGLICESQGYGIGAHAYYRRIVEDVINDLLESIADFISSKEELSQYKEALEEVKKTRVAQEKIEIVKDLVPNTLRPGGINPLQVLYDELSEGIHLNSDEECLESADAIRKSLTYLAKQVINKKAEQDDFTEGMKKLLDKKTKKRSIKE